MINFKEYIIENEFEPIPFKLYKHVASFNPGMIGYSFYDSYEYDKGTTYKKLVKGYHKFDISIHTQTKYKIMDVSFQSGNSKLSKQHLDLVKEAILDAINHLRFNDNYTIRFKSSNMSLIQHELARIIPRSRLEGETLKVGDSLEIDSHKDRLDATRERLRWK